MVSFNNYLITLLLEQIYLSMLTILLVRSQQIMLPVDCNHAPSGFIEICIQLRQFDIATRAALAFESQQPQVIINAPGIPHNRQLSPAVPHQASYVPSVYDCLDLQCLCPYFRGILSPDGKCHLQNGQILQKAVRKEIRMLTDIERERFFNAVQQIKASGEYNRFAFIHRQESTESGAHSGPSFLLWHREFMKRIEIALRLIDPSVALPYWDSRLDQPLPDPKGSIMWSAFLMGDSNSYGQVINGPFAGFVTLEGHPTITRHLGEEGRLLTDQNIETVYGMNKIEDILAYTAPTEDCPYPPNFYALEYYHANVHVWVGGDMKPPSTSANDPVFFLHHSFVDHIFENWRQMHQNRIQREEDFPPEITSCATPLHFANAYMRPFNLVNKQGLSNAYTDYLYTYEPRPSCNLNQPTCHSQFLFCDLLHGPAKCVSKLKLGQRCDHFASQDACYKGICSQGHCRPNNANSNQDQTQNHKMVAAKQRVNNTSSTVREILDSIHNSAVTRRPVMETECLNDGPCCSIWAQNNECPSNVEYMKMYCRKSCGYCKSNDNRQSGCFDRHISCSYMRMQGECIRRRQWMAENCQASCGWCSMSTYDLCVRTALISRLK